MHIPVLKKEALKFLDPKPNENFIDCTVGQGGHSAAILKRNGPGGKVLGIDLELEQIGNLGERIILAKGSYANLKKIVEKLNFGPVSGILFDLGMSSWHLEKSGRGFSFLKNEPLDMRYGAAIEETAIKIINSWPEAEIVRVLEEYGEERFAKRIARKIIEKRNFNPIETTSQLVEVIKEAVPAKFRHSRLHFATRVFQALRIAVNDELNNLNKSLPQAVEVLSPGGRLVIISFHSLEDRIVKNFFKESSQLEILTKKPIIPSQEEIKINPRSRSAKLRAAIKK